MIIGGPLNNIKAAFYDFDDTLVVTKKKIYRIFFGQR